VPGSPPPLNFGLSNNCRKSFLSENVRTRNAKFGAENPTLGNLGAKMKFGAPSVGNLQLSVVKLQLSAPPIVTRDAAAIYINGSVR